MSVAAISAVTVTLLLVGSFISILLNINKLATDVENDVSVRVYIDLAATKDQKTQLKEELQKLSNVDSIDYSSRESELEKVVGSYGSEFTLFGGDDNPLYDVYVVSTESPQDTEKVAKAAEKLTYVAKVNYGGSDAKKLFKFVSTIRNVGSVIIVALLLTAIFLISNTIRITILSRSTEIEIMKLVGATNGFIRWPFLLEGAWIGFFGAVLPITILSFIYVAIYNFSTGALQGTYFALLTPNPFLIQIGGLLLGIGIIIGAFGSLISMRRFLKV
ncbi:cell division ABC transporter, permease protein FtsX [Carnobacterium maltaromaticum DSM 20342]|nr:cell division ABC transporter, permease protein FtsX [Carnobacterium maltaromaticum DSM 20342]KRN72043.1 cell division ABC transporter, permease protein FtsX [Carnobacterium maltaromaticum]KRN85955.1 cell division ABC transporter, permease protein FtsX [Carnobacterium maltaromaticum]